ESRLQRTVFEPVPRRRGAVGKGDVALRDVEALAMTVEGQRRVALLAVAERMILIPVRFDLANRLVVEAEVVLDVDLLALLGEVPAVAAKPVALHVQAAVEV